MRRLLEEYVAGVYRFAVRLTGNPHDAEDLTQEVMLRAWRGRGRLRDRRTARSWLFRITANLWKDTLRSRRRSSREDTVEAESEDRVESPALAMEHKEDAQRALAALDALPRRQREVMYLHVCEGMALAEIAELLEIEYTAVKASLAAGRKRMRSQLRDLFQETRGEARRR